MKKVPKELSFPRRRESTPPMKMDTRLHGYDIYKVTIPIQLTFCLLFVLVGCQKNRVPVAASLPGLQFDIPTAEPGATMPASTEPPQTASNTPSTQPDLFFQNATISAELQFQHSTILTRKKDGSKMMGGGAAGDFNNDGWVDLFLIGGGYEADGLFINQGDGTFNEQAAAAGVAAFHVGSGAAVADYDDDGWLDIFVTSFGAPEAMGPGQHLLYHNNGDGTFTDVAADAGIQQTSSVLADGFGATFGDYDLDGDLDLFVAGWRVKPEVAQGNRLFQNNGDGTFTDVTDGAGILDAGIRGFSPCLADMDGDRYPELLLVADFGSSRYFINNRDSTFTDFTLRSETGREWSGMGLATGDFNNDGLLDWYATAIFDDDAEGRGDGNKLYLNQGNHEYLEVAGIAGVADGGWGWGAMGVDLNHDGWLDLVETNGWSDLPSYSNELSKVWLASGEGTFREVAENAGMQHQADGLGVLHFDSDNDGDQDMVITTLNGSPHFYRNELNAPDSNWLRIFLDTKDYPNLAANGIGSRVWVRTGEKEQVRDILSCPHYLSQSELSAHFGLGVDAVVDEIRVQWADGSETVVGKMPANQTITISPDG